MKIYIVGEPPNAVAPFNLEIGISEEKAIEKGINAIAENSGPNLETKIPIMVNTNGPANEISASSWSVAFSYFIPNLEEGVVLNSGHNTAEKNSLPALKTDIIVGRINHAGKPLD